MTNPLVVLDSNIIISSLLKSNSASSRIIGLWTKHYFDLISSTYIISEVKKTLIDKQLSKKYHFSPTKQSRLISQLIHFSKMVNPPVLSDIVRDQKDNPILSTAISGHADYLVTGDQDLLVLAKNNNLQPLQILSPHDFLHEFMSSDDELLEYLEGREQE